MKIKLELLRILFCLFVLICGTFFVIAAGDDVPLGPDSLSIVQNERINLSQHLAKWHKAEAGNVTELRLHGIGQTKSWQGYYGSITGVIVLDDAQNWTLYDWPNPDPTGEIYAVNRSATPSWKDVHCFNYSAKFCLGYNTWRSGEII